MTVTEVSFFAYGNPAAQGSKKHVGHGVMVETSKQLPSWRASVIEYARKAYTGPPLDGALELQVIFWFPHLPSYRKRARYKTTTPDLDKLVRAVGDALKLAGTIRDDGHIAIISTAKRLQFIDDAGRISPLGADITVAVLDNGERTPSHG